MLHHLETIRASREQGFTLIELLVVILIIGILTAVAVPMFMNQRTAAVGSQVQSDLRNAVTQGGIKFSSQGIPEVLPDYLTTSSGTTMRVTLNDPTTNNDLLNPYPSASADRWRVHLTPGIEPRPTRTNHSSGGWNGLPYMSATFPSGHGSGGAYQGIAMSVPQGTVYTAGVAVRSSVDTTIRINIEWKNPSDPFADMSPTAHTIKAGEWAFLTTTGSNRYTDSTGVTVTAYSTIKEVNQTIEFTSIMLNQGSAVDPQGAMEQGRFCIQAGHQDFPDIQYRYSLREAQIVEGVCGSR